MRRLAFTVLALALSGCGGPGATAPGSSTQQGVAVGFTADTYYYNEFAAGVTAYQQKNWAQVIAHETQAIQRAPDLYPAYVERGSAYGQEGNFAADIADQSKAIALAQTHGSGGYADAASEDQFGGPRHNPVVIYPAYNGRAAAYMATGQYTLALADVTEAIKLQPADPVLYNQRCWIRAKLGDLPNALQDCNQALALTPKNPEILDSRGYVYLQMKNYNSSIADYNAALAIDPKQASSLYGLGLAMRAQNDPGADAKIAQAEAIDPQVAATFEN